MPPSPSNPSGKPTPKSFWGWVGSWFTSAKPAKASFVATPAKTTENPSAETRPDYLKRVQTLISQNKTVATWIEKLQREISLPTYRDNQLPEKLAQFMTAAHDHRNTAGDGSTPTTPDYYRVNFNELDSSLPALQQRAMRFFIKEFMNSPMQNWYPDYFKSRSPKDYRVIQVHAGDNYSAYKGAFVDSPEYFLERLKTGAANNETAFIRALAFDDAFPLLAIVMHEAALKLAEHKAFPDPLENDEDVVSQRQAMSAALESVYHPDAEQRKTGLQFFTALALENRVDLIEKTLTHFASKDEVI